MALLARLIVLTFPWTAPTHVIRDGHILAHRDAGSGDLLPHQVKSSRVGIALDLYSHVLPGMQEDVVSRVDEALRLAIEKRAAKDIR